MVQGIVTLVVITEIDKQQDEFDYKYSTTNTWIGIGNNVFLGCLRIIVAEQRDKIEIYVECTLETTRSLPMCAFQDTLAS